MSGNANVPKLRFPEFRDAGEWKLIPLNKQAKRCTRKNRDGEVKRVFTNSAEYGVVDQRDYFDKDIATQGNLEGYFIVEKRDYVYNPRISATAPVGPISKNNIATGVMSPLYTVFRFTNGENDFYAFYFKTTGWHHYMRQASSTGARHDRMAIANDDFMAMPLPVTCPEEQQKIADCLSSLDELIAAEAQQLAALKAHKKGLMQQLFPAEGETVPRLRFPEFRDAPEWGGKTAGTLFANRVEDGEDGLPIYSVTMNDGMVKRSSLERRVDDIAESGGNKKVCKDDIAYNMMRMWQGAFGVSKEDCMVSPAYVVLSPENDACPNFFGHLFKLPKYLQLLTSHSQGLTLDRLRLYYKDFARIPVLIPSPPEQQKIADCLTSLDNLIAAQAQQTDRLKAHKKGLMQQLFPSADEVAE